MNRFGLTGNTDFHLQIKSLIFEKIKVQRESRLPAEFRRGSYADFLIQVSLAKLEVYKFMCLSVYNGNGYDFALQNRWKRMATEFVDGTEHNHPEKTVKRASYNGA